MRTALHDDALRQVHPLEQRVEARMRAIRLEKRKGLNIDKEEFALLVRSVERFKHIIHFACGSVIKGSTYGVAVCIGECSHQFQALLSITKLMVNRCQAPSSEVVPRRNSQNLLEGGNGVCWGACLNLGKRHYKYDRVEVLIDFHAFANTLNRFAVPARI